MIAIQHILDSIRGVPGVRLFPAASVEAIAAAQRSLGTRFPAAYAEFLSQTNGASFGDGHFTLFGVGEGGPRDLVAWNRPETWKFAWGDHLKDLICFARTRVGGQLAFSVADSIEDRPVVFMSLNLGLSHPLPAAPSVAEWLSTGVPANAHRLSGVGGVDEIKRRFPALAASEVLCQVPSIQFTGDEDFDALQRMDAVLSLIVDGDLSRQLADANGSIVTGVFPYVDNNGRPRIRLLTE